VLNRVAIYSVYMLKGNLVATAIGLPFSFYPAYERSFYESNASN
jgi:hypothetical protein